MKRYLVILIVSCPLLGFAQTSEDALLTALDQINPADKDSIYYELYLFYIDSNPVKSVEYAQKHLQHTIESNDLEKQITSYRILGKSLHKNHKYDSARKALEKALKLAIKISNENELIKVYADLGAIYFSMDDYKKSVEHFLAFVRLSKELNNSKYVAIGYNNLGLIYYRIGDYNTALNFYLDCLKTKKSIGLNKDILINYHNIGLCYIRLSDYNNAIKYFNKIIQECKNCENDNLFDAYYGLGKAYFYMNRKEQALYYLKKSSDIAYNEKNYIDFANSISMISELLIKKKEYNDALSYLEMIDEIQFELPSSIDYKIKLLYSEIFEKKGEYKKALEYKNKYLFLKDSVFSDTKVSEIKNLLIDYQQSENEEIIKAKEIQLQRNRQFVYLFGALIILMTLLLFFIYRNLKFRKRLNEKLSTLVYQRTQDLNSFLYRTSHDLAGPVATIKGLLSLMSLDEGKSDVQNLITRLDTTNHRLEEIVQKLNTITKINSKTIEYENVDIESLVLDIFDRIDIVNDTLIDIKSSGKKYFRTDRTLMNIILYNILLNSVQHKDHRENRHQVKVGIKNNGILKITISDNGKGIESNYTDQIFEMFYVANDKRNGNGLGLYQARVAAQRIRGDIELINHKKPVVFCITLQKPKEIILPYTNNKN